MSRRVATPAVLAISGLALLAVVGACSDDRDGFKTEPELVPPLPAEDAGACPFQCSLDGRSVIRSCDGSVVETCSETQACGAAVCQEPCAAAAADSRSDGCEFYVQNFPLNDDGCLATFVVNTSAQPVEIGLDKGDEVFDLSKAVWRTNPGDATLIAHEGPIPAGESVILFVSGPAKKPSGAAGRVVKCPDGVVPATDGHALTRTGIGSSLRLTASAPVSAVAMLPFGGAISFKPAATLLLPVVTWSKAHVLVDGWESDGPGGQPASQIVASEDGTEITLIAKKPVANGIGVVGGPAGTPLTYSLNKGQHLQLHQQEELIGSVVLSNKPTTIFGGNTCTDVPTHGGACDMLWQQIPSFEHWGSEYVSVGYRQRTPSSNELMPYRIVAAKDGTRLDYDPVIPPGAPTEMNAGDVATFPVGVNDAFVVRTQDAEHPIYVAAYMQGYYGTYYGTPYLGTGDPEFVNVVPAGQWRNSYSFYADPTYDETSLVIVRAKNRDKFEDVWLECAGNLEGWAPAGTRGEYEYVRVDLQRNRGPGQAFGDKVCQTGLHRMKSEGPFTATIWGWAFAASYAYPGGMATRKLVESPLLPIQ